MLKKELTFTKMQALGNDYVYIDAISQTIENPNELSRQISDRHFGVGSDGLVLICPSGSADFRMRMFNRDGSEAEMCGNAVRSVAKYVYTYGLTSEKEIKIETLGGIKSLFLEVRGTEVTNITADIGEPVLASEKVPVITDGPTFIGQPVTLDDRLFHTTAMSLGNPHCVSFVENVFNFDLEKYGPLMETNPIYPQKINVEFCEVIGDGKLRLRTWERNTGETLACGTGCCACVVAGTLNGLCKPAADVEQLGGFIRAEWDQSSKHLFMTGPSEIVFEGTWRIRD